MSLSLDLINKELEYVCNQIEKGKIEVLAEKVLSYQKVSSPFNKYIQGDQYPDIEFTIRSDDYEKIKTFVDLLNCDREDKAFEIKEALADNALGKFFYALAWKQGDLVKLDTLLAGLKKAHGDKPDDDNVSLVFTQFGAHLANPDDFSIVDQHIIRAFNYYRLYLNKETTLTKSLLNANNDRIARNSSRLENIFRFKKEDIECFEGWLNSAPLSLNQETRRVIDKCLFTLGRAMNSDHVKKELENKCNKSTCDV